MDVLLFAVTSIGSAVISGAFFLLVQRAYARVSSRWLWQLRDPKTARIFVADSTTTDTGEYVRPATGIGQVRALAALAPSLARAYPEIDFDRTLMASECTGEMLESDLVVLGGPKNNQVSRDLLAALGDRCPARQEGSQIIWSDGSGKQRAYSGIVEQGDVKRDVGLVIQCPNPLNKNRTLILVSGSHTYGTVAAARYFVQRGRTLPDRRNGSVALVEADVRHGHVFAPRLLHEAALSDSLQAAAAASPR
jgi:hypothetical protein